MAGQDVIEISNVSKRYGDVVALAEVSLEIVSGEFFTLLGPSGAGKSTLLHMVGGFVDPDGGTIRIGGEDITGLQPQDRPVSTVFQEYALFPHLNVADNVRYGLEVEGVDRTEQEEIVERYLGMLQIAELKERAPSQLSGGQRQRVALARSLVTEPEILLLDEPLGPLDEKLRREMQVELKELQESLNTTFIYVTHDQEEALTMSDRVCILNFGEVIETGTPEEIYQSPQRKFTAEFIGAGNLLDGRVSKVDGEYATLETAFSSSEIRGRTRVPQIEPGDDAAMVIRPHHFSTSKTDSINRIVGTVQASVFKGHVYEYVLSVDDGLAIKAAFDDPLNVQEGEQVELTWTQDNSVVVV